MHGGSEGDPSLYDMVINLEHLSIEDASDAIAHLATVQRSPAIETADRIALDNLAISSRVEAALALDSSTGQLALDVEADGGLVHVRGKVPNLEALNEVLRVAQRVPDVGDFNLDEVTIGNYEIATSFSGRPSVPGGHGALLNRAGWWSTSVVMGLVFCLGIVYSIGIDRIVSEVVTSILPRPTSEVQTFAGVVTDTLCGADHRTTEAASVGECVRACVRLRGARYALYDGRNLYAL